MVGVEHTACLPVATDKQVVRSYHCVIGTRVVKLTENFKTNHDSGRTAALNPILKNQVIACFKNKLGFQPKRFSCQADSK